MLYSDDESYRYKDEELNSLRITDLLNCLNSIPSNKNIKERTKALYLYYKV